MSIFKAIMLTILKYVIDLQRQVLWPLRIFVKYILYNILVKYDVIFLASYQAVFVLLINCAVMRCKHWTSV